MHRVVPGDERTGALSIAEIHSWAVDECEGDVLLGHFERL